MKKLKKIFACLLLVLPGLSAISQESWAGLEHLFTPVEQYVVYRTEAPLQIDGIADEPAWKQSSWSADFRDIEDDKKPQPLFRTRVKMLWDEDNLYVYAELEEPHIWAYYTDHDQIVYHENDFEVFVDPDGDGYNYFEFEVNAQNTLFDLFLPMPYRNGGIPLLSWDAHGFESAVSLVGTLNDPSDADELWAVEMKVPFSDMQTGMNRQVPKEGETWKINFSRVHWQTGVVDGTYRKKKDPATGRDLPEYNWVWSPPGLINMHYPERWGMLQFSAERVGSTPVAFCMPAGGQFRKYVWLVYYRQQKYKADHGRFASGFEELDLEGLVNEIEGQSCNLSMLATDFQFTVQLIMPDGLELSVNEAGLFRKKQK
ncbi:carbohydrate-binding family 9-like protein [Gaoshiqia sediminis]|uniref:Carbohydrate-binding family 9-like protein n=1 Tax=Gaoshiqia sediminis TaxID=2986998 RepID=A0AA41Y0N6_9BACT|nr:carbohydrate-binding family 9-like protein [Gaoshiqia sediminis]MCW0481296.1 carbohydrate-binding family 9-like protein [Gaoshiqia sediminis]